MPSRSRTHSCTKDLRRAARSTLPCWGAESHAMRTLACESGKKRLNTSFTRRGSAGRGRGRRGHSCTAPPRKDRSAPKLRGTGPTDSSPAPTSAKLVAPKPGRVAQQVWSRPGGWRGAASVGSAPPSSAARTSSPSASTARVSTEAHHSVQGARRQLLWPQLEEGLQLSLLWGHGGGF